MYLQGTAMKCLPLLVTPVAGAGSFGRAHTPLLAPADISPFDVGDPSGQVLLADLDNDAQSIAGGAETTALRPRACNPYCPGVHEATPQALKDFAGA